MGQHYNVRVPDGMCFCFDGLNKKCYPGTGSVFTEIKSGITGTRAGSTGTISLDSTLGKPHLRWNGTVGTRVAYIPFSVDIYGNTGVKVPYGASGSWSWWQYFEDQGSQDHPNIGWETGSSWDGANGFVFGTGWGTDGPRWGVADTQYTVYSTASPDYQTNTWQNWTVTFDGNATNGLKTYLNGSLIDQRTPSTTTISAVNTNDLYLGATQSRGGNWGGYMDVVQMWDRTLSANEVGTLYQSFRGRFE